MDLRGIDLQPIRPTWDSFGITAQLAWLLGLGWRALCWLWATLKLSPLWSSLFPARPEPRPNLRKLGRAVAIAGRLTQDHGQAGTVRPLGERWFGEQDG